MDWSLIQPYLGTIVPVTGGFSSAKRGFVTLPDSRTVFVKIATNAENLAWLQKEIRVYRTLPRYGFDTLPNLLSVNEDESMFALEVLAPADGWDWSNHWTLERLKVTLTAMDNLQAINLSKADRSALSGGPALSQASNGWVALAADETLRSVLFSKISESLQIEIQAHLSNLVTQSSRYRFLNDSLGHHDVRADNCAWHAGKSQVRLIDWNWLDYGDRKIDLAGFLVHVHQNGVNVLEAVPERLDVDALEFLAGYWFKAASTPIWPGDR